MSELEFWHHHGGVSVPDLEAAIDWYGSVLGFEPIVRTTIETIPAKMAMLRNGNLHIELFEAPKAVPAAQERFYPDTDILTHGTKHFSFACADVDPFADELKRRGADIVWVKHFPDGRANIFLRDNNGNLIEFVQAAKPAPAESSL